MTPRSVLHLGIRGKLFLLSIALILAGLLGAQVYSSRALARDLDARAHAELLARVGLSAAAIEAAGAFAPAAADALVRRLGAESNARVTLIAPDGVVVADSSVPLAQVPALDNHGSRPEVRAARAQGTGSSSRESGTLHEPLIYLARRITDSAGTVWVVRLAIRPTALADSQQATLRFLLVGVLVGLLAAALLTSVGVSLVTRPVRALTATARRMVGDFSVRTRLRPDDEVGELAEALDQLADGLTASLSSLERERDRLEAILEAMAEGVLVTGPEGTIVLANRALREMLLVGRDVIGRTPVEAVRIAELQDSISEAARQRAPVSREIAVTGLRPRVLMARLSPIDPAVTGVVAVLTDVTELRRLETVRRDFVANVSHELRTPVAAVRAAVETLRDGALAQPDAAEEFLSIIERHAQRLHHLVEDLLELSRIEARELKLELERLEVRALVERTLELFRLAAERKKIALGTDIAADLPPVLADRRAVEMVLSNLVDNAIKYSPEGRPVTVQARVGEAGAVKITVIDSGAGIEARHLPRLFERFYRVDPGRSRQVGGTGLGLAIVKHLVEAVGGTVGVESTVGRGSRFAVSLPRAEGESTPPAAPVLAPG